MPMGMYICIPLTEGYIVHIGVGSNALLVLDYRAISGPLCVERAAASLHVFCIRAFLLVYVYCSRLMRAHFNN